MKSILLGCCAMLIRTSAEQTANNGTARTEPDIIKYIIRSNINTHICTKVNVITSIYNRRNSLGDL